MKSVEKLKILPDEPGVYLIKDSDDEVIYVGKAASLRNRVRSYFQPYQQKTDPKVRSLMENIADFEYIVTESEVEALVLEDNLIKGYRPRFNVRLKDDKRFPYLKLTVQESFPRLLLARLAKKDGARYFGPYTDVRMMRETINLLRRLFPIRTCNDVIENGKSRSRPCLDYFIKQCTAPCTERISPQEYRRITEGLCRFLEGRHEEALAEMRQEMREAATKLEFERATRLRDRITAFERLVGRPRVVSSSQLEDRDAIGLAKDNGLCCVHVFFVRDGKVKGRERFFMEAPDETRSEEVLSAFIKQFYAEASFIPKEILLPQRIEEERVIVGWLSAMRGSKVHLSVPQRGPKHRLIKLATHNAKLALMEEEFKNSKQRDQGKEALQELRGCLGLKRLPQRIEAYDISNTQGSEAVGAMVVFENGLPKKSDYRRFKIRSAKRVDDYAMMSEVVQRRLQRAEKEQTPDLVVIDGGKGQLSVVRRMMRLLGWKEIPTIGLAKEFEHIFVEGQSEPIVLPRDSQALYLLQRVRDEAHRFALSYHRLRRKRSVIKSALDEIPGVGPKRKKLLLQHFGSLRKVKEASLEELAALPGIPQNIAQCIYNSLHDYRLSEG